MTDTIFWKVQQQTFPIVLENRLTEQELKTWQRIKKEPESLLEEDIYTEATRGKMIISGFAGIDKTKNAKKASDKSENTEEWITHFLMWKVLLKEAYKKVLGVVMGEEDTTYIIFD